MIISKSEREFILFLLGRYAEIMWEEIAWWSKKKKNMTTEWQNEKSVLSIEFAADIDSWFRGSSQVIIVEVFEDAYNWFSELDINLWSCPNGFTLFVNAHGINLVMLERRPIVYHLCLLILKWQMSYHSIDVSTCTM